MKILSFFFICLTILLLSMAALQAANSATIQVTFHTSMSQRRLTLPIKPHKAIRVHKWQPSIGQWDGMDSTYNMSGLVKHLVQDGIKYVGRYYFRSSTSKVALTHSEAVTLSTNNIQLFAIWEQGGGDNSGGTGYYTYNQGVLDGQSAYFAAYGISQPGSSAIYFCCDTDFTSSAMNNPNANPTLYMRGAQAGMYNAYHATVQQSDPQAPVYLAGMYGSGLVISSVKANNLVNYTWMAESTGWQQYDDTKNPGGYKGWDIHQFEQVGYQGLLLDPDIRHNTGAGFFLVSGP